MSCHEKLKTAGAAVTEESAESPAGDMHGYGKLTRPIVVRGGGDLATGTIFMLSKAGYPVIILECQRPTAIRREAAFSEAAGAGEKRVEDVTCIKADDAGEALRLAKPGRPVLLIDETAESLTSIRPQVLIDAVIAKKNIGTRIDMAELTIALGPGFTAGKDVRFVIETMRGHHLGRIIPEGSAFPNTGIPGEVGGFARERVIHAPAAGILREVCHIGDLVSQGQTIAEIRPKDGSAPVGVPASISGVLRGILPDGFDVPSGMKMADIDPRPGQRNNCYTISDKARCIGGSVLQLVSAYEHGLL